MKASLIAWLVLICLLISPQVSAQDQQIQVEEISTRSGWTGAKLATKFSWMINGQRFEQVDRFGVTKRVCPPLVTLLDPTTWNVWKFIPLTPKTFGQPLPGNATITKLEDNIFTETCDALDPLRRFTSTPPTFGDGCPERKIVDPTFTAGISGPFFPLCFSTHSCPRYDPTQPFLGAAGYTPELLAGCCGEGAALGGNDCPTEPIPPDGIDREAILRDSLTVRIQRFRQTLPDGTVQEGPRILAQFNPRFVISLDEAAAFLGYDHFNWLSIVTEMPILDPQFRDLEVIDPQNAEVRLISDLLNRIRDSEDNLPTVPFIDPPPGGYAYAGELDDAIWYWCEELPCSVVKEFSLTDHLRDTDNDGRADTLEFIDDPNMPHPFNIRFATALVGVFADGRGEVISEVPTINWEYVSEAGGQIIVQPFFDPRIVTSGSIKVLEVIDPSDYGNELLNLLEREGIGIHGASTTIPVVFLIIDEDSVDNGTPPNFFSAQDVNDHLADIGLRTQLPFFAANVGQVLTFHTGQVGDEGWFALKSVPASWAGAGPTADGLRNYLDAGPGLGTTDASGNREALLDKVPNVTPLRATGLKLLEGRQVCAVVYDGSIPCFLGHKDRPPM